LAGHDGHFYCRFTLLRPIVQREHDVSLARLSEL
jgi:hypothetical protein